MNMHLAFLQPQPSRKSKTAPTRFCFFVACGLMVFSFVITTVSLASEQTLFIGLSDVHKILWADYLKKFAIWETEVQKQANLVEEDRAMETRLLMQFESLSNRLDTLRWDQAHSPALSKGEFETTAQFAERRKSALASSEAELRVAKAAYSDAQQAIDKFHALQKSRASLTTVASPPNFSINAPSDIFLIPVFMGPYDADHNRIPSFTALVEYPVEDEPDGPRLYGMTGFIGGMKADVETAKTIRTSSDQRRLFAVFHAKPLIREFSSQKIEYIPGKPPAKASDTENKLMALGAGLIASMLGGDGPQTMGQVMAGQEIYHPNSVTSSGTPSSQKITPVKLICLSWEGTAELDQLYDYNSYLKSWTLLWRKETP